ncbi:MAG: zinc-binding dehydrogenase [Candidatus Omnitrophica bacterium]|nr:zinc-binding dehydrogenase [Candidatus Omnitrophota bacterium]
MITRAAVLYKTKGPLRIEELEVPDLQKGQVLVKVRYSGVCHSQLNEIDGLKGKDVFLPHTLGHEGSGVVEQVGAGVTKVTRWDNVVLSWIKGKGLDARQSLYRKANGSIVNSGPISTFLTKAVVSENRLIKIPNNIDLKEAALLGCAITTGGGMIIHSAKLRARDSLAIFGVGGIGLSALAVAKTKGASVIIAVDISGKKLARAKKFGATHFINARQEDPLKKILRITKGRGVDYAIDAAGKAETMECAFKAVRNNGGLCIVAGNLAAGQTISIDPFELIRGKRIIGSWGGEARPDADIPFYIRLIKSGKLNVSSMITHKFKLHEINSAFSLLRKGDCSRIVVEL